jgi:hypothetical protein
VSSLTILILAVVVELALGPPNHPRRMFFNQQNFADFTQRAVRDGFVPTGTTLRNPQSSNQEL